MSARERTRHGTPAAGAALDRLNALSPNHARAELLRVSGSRAWARRVAAVRPFADPAALLAAAEDAWDSLAPDDWREAFAAHPRIGETRTAHGETASAWSRAEQSRAAATGDAVRVRLGEAQRRYEARFGHGFLICATGMTADEILEACEARLSNDPSTELRIAAGEERAIGRLRLEKLLSDILANDRR